MNNKIGNSGRQTRRKKSSSDSAWNVLTVMMLIGTLLACGYFYSLFSNPYSALNPFPPNTPTLTPIPPTWTPLGFEATWTPTLTLVPSPSFTPRPTYTLEATNTPFSLASATSIFTETKTPKPTGAPYIATITYYESSATFRPDTDCGVMLVAGRVIDSKNTPVISLIVKLGGSLPGKVFIPPIQTLAGIATGYGPSGFEFNPEVAPVSTSNSLWVQLFDQNSTALSNQIFVTTYNDCKKNLIFVQFQQK